MTALRLEGAVGAQPVARPRADAGDEAAMNVADPLKRQAGDLGRSGVVEGTEPDAVRVGGEDSDIDAAIGDGDAEGTWQTERYGETAGQGWGSGDDGRRGPPGPRDEFGDVAGRGDEIGERLRGRLIELRPVGLVALDIDADGRPAGAGPRQAEDDARAALEEDADPLPGRARAVDRIVVGEIVGVPDGHAAQAPSGQRRERISEMLHQTVGSLRIDLLVVVAGIEIPPLRLPVAVPDLGDALAAAGEDVEPEKHRPQSVFFANMARSGAGAFLAANGGKAGVEEG